MTKERIEDLIQKTRNWRTDCIRIMYGEHTREYMIAKMEMENYIKYLERLIKIEENKN